MRHPAWGMAAATMCKIGGRCIDLHQLEVAPNLLSLAFSQKRKSAMMTDYGMGFGGVGMILMLVIAVLVVFALVKYIRK